MTKSDKLYYKIGEVAKITGLKPYILRYWENEFTFAKPTKNDKGQRVYTQEDIDKILEIKKLLYDKKFTIPGAREELKKDADQRSGEPIHRSRLVYIRDQLQELLSLLSN